MTSPDRKPEIILTPDKVAKLLDKALAKALLYMHHKTPEIHRGILLNGRPESDLERHQKRTAAIYRAFAERGLSYDHVESIAEGKNG